MEWDDVAIEAQSGGANAASLSRRSDGRLGTRKAKGMSWLLAFSHGIK